MKQLREKTSAFLKRKKGQETLGSEKVERITNKTVADHREEVLSGARKFIYPLQHPKRHIVGITTTIVVLSVVAFFTLVTLALYRYNTTSVFMYRVTQVIPFPVARAGNTFVAYENYLFELRHYIHYYENQQGLDFESDAGQQQLAEFRQRALEKVINDAYVKRIADREGITVAASEIDAQIDVARRQARLGNSEQVLEDVLRDFWDWSMVDFRRSLEQQILTQKVLSHLDTDTHDRANQALLDIRSGTDFEDVVAEYSEDPATVSEGGVFNAPITRTTRDVAPQTVDALFALEPGEVSDVINIGYALQIVRLLEREGDTVRGAHVLLPFEGIDTYLNEEKAQDPARVYVQNPPAVVEPVLENNSSEPASSVED